MTKLKLTDFKYGVISGVSALIIHLLGMWSFFFISGILYPSEDLDSFYVIYLHMFSQGLFFGVTWFIGIIITLVLTFYIIFKRIDKKDSRHGYPFLLGNLVVSVIFYFITMIGEILLSSILLTILCGDCAGLAI